MVQSGSQHDLYKIQLLCTLKNIDRFKPIQTGFDDVLSVLQVTVYFAFSR